MKMYKFFGLFIIVSYVQSMELSPLNINNFNNFTNYNYHISHYNLDNQHDNQINQKDQEGWGFFSLNGLIKNKNIFLNNKKISLINQNEPIGNEYDQLINGKYSFDLQQSVNNPEVPTEIAPNGTVYWNGNYCFYGDGDVNSMWISTIEKSYSKIFLQENKNAYNNFIDPKSDKIYKFYSTNCNKQTCTTINLNGTQIKVNNFLCPNSKPTQVASDEKNTLWKNSWCFYKPINFTSSSSFSCYYPFQINTYMYITLNNLSDTQLKYNNIDDNFFCYPYLSKQSRPENCLKEKLDLLSINSNNFQFFFPQQFSKTTLIWDEDHKRCFYYDGVQINYNKVFYYGNLPYMYSYHSINSSCNINSCKNNKIVPRSNGFSCSSTPLLRNSQLNKVIVRQSANPLAPTEVASAGSTYWNGNYCLYSSGDINSSLISLIQQSYDKTFSVNRYSQGSFDPNSDKIYTFVSGACNKQTCTTINLNGISISNGFICPNANPTQLASNEKNTLWKYGRCFHKPITFTEDSPFYCYYPAYGGSYSSFEKKIGEQEVWNYNVDDNFFCYPYSSRFVQPEDCVKEKLDLLNINSNDFKFFFPKQFFKTTLIWDEDHNRCFYYDGIEVNYNKFFYYGNLPYMYSYHSNDLSCNINNCKDGMTISSNQNQFQCQKINPAEPYSIKTYYPVNFSMIEDIFNAIGSLFKIPSMDTLHWAIYYPLIVILYPLSPWITVFWEPWINFANSIQLFMAIKNP